MKKKGKSPKGRKKLPSHLVVTKVIPDRKKVYDRKKENKNWKWDEL